MSNRCEMELCPNWSGDGGVCPCAVLGLERPTEPGKLTDLIGIAPNLTGGLDPSEYVQRQYCDHGPQLDAHAAEVDALRQRHHREIGAHLAGQHDHADDCAACSIRADDREVIAQLRGKLEEARSWARHGYEIGQRSCLWADQGVAPKWLTDGWPHHFDADPLLEENSKLERDLEAARADLKRERNTHTRYAEAIETQLNKTRAELDEATKGVRARLASHYLAQIVCDHERGLDNPVCACSRVHLGWHPSVGAAVAAWIDHTLGQPAPAAGDPAGQDGAV